MGIEVGDIKGIEDLNKLPFTTKQDLRDNYPYGFFAVPMKKVVRVHASSGTTGQPTVVGYTKNDLDTWANCMARVLVGMGATEDDVVQNSLGYGFFTGGLGFHYGTEKLGATIVPISSGNTKKQIQIMREFGSTMLVTTPSYALYLAESIRSMGIDPATDLKLRIGARGVFSNESGLGSAPIAAAAAKTHWPAEQGLISMTGTFIDSILICTLTGLTLVITGIWTTDTSAALMTQGAFSTVFGSFGGATLSICLVLFAFTTILGWNYYGEHCIEFLFGVKGIKPYRLVFVLMVALGGFLQIQLVWTIADIVNALMAFPNLIALLALSGVVVKETKAYFNHLKQEEITATTSLEKEAA